MTQIVECAERSLLISIVQPALRKDTPRIHGSALPNVLCKVLDYSGPLDSPCLLDSGKVASLAERLADLPPAAAGPLYLDTAARRRCIRVDIVVLHVLTYDFQEPFPVRFGFS